MRYLIFEDELTYNFTPLTLTQPCFDLVLGAKTLLEQLTQDLKAKQCGLLVQKHLEKAAKRRHQAHAVNPEQVDDDATLVNGLLRMEAPHVTRLLSKRSRYVAHAGGHVAVARVSRASANRILARTRSALPPVSGLLHEGVERLTLPEPVFVRYPWELIELNPAVLKRQTPRSRRGEADGPFYVLGPRQHLVAGRGAQIEDRVCFDTRRGPVWLDEGAEVHCFARIAGPAYVGRNAIIGSSSIVGSSAIHHFSRVGGEVEGSIVAAYSNKQHAGFIGHSYIGEWVNIGAMTVNSNLKNTYGDVKMMVSGRRVDTRSPKVGCFIADNAKTSIGTCIYTGRRVGVASHLHGYVTEDVPSFTIYSKSLNNRAVELEVESAVETQRRMMERRGVKQTAEEAELLRTVYKMTKDERYRTGVTPRRFEL